MRLVASSSFQCFAAAATADATMYASRASSRGGRDFYRRGFSDRSNSSSEAPVSGDSHFRSVRDANSGFRQGPRGRFGGRGGYPQQNFRPRPPIGQPPRPHYGTWRPKPVDFRNWEYALKQPPFQCERFVFLSYNILADYLAMKHRRELYFHIPRHILDWQRRVRNIVFELGLWSPDIMCLQEVDRFQDLEEALKSQGYDGLWKMRTGNAVDGCAIFWRRTRFKMVHEESIEFNKLGLRDNVAQICVLESSSSNASENGTEAFPSSQANRVVVCNIHVLYNPKRGEIKLGQVRVLLDRAHAISKIWNEAPIVIGGDFNCTPRSPLYNYILEQTLSLSGLDRDQVSGQYSAEITAVNPFPPNSWDVLNRAQTTSNTIGASMSVGDTQIGNEHTNCFLDLHVQNNSLTDINSAPSIENLSPPEGFNFGQVIPDAQCRNGTGTSAAAGEEIKQITIEGHKDEIDSAVLVLDDCLKENLSTDRSEGGLTVDLGDNGSHEVSPPLTTACDDSQPEVVEFQDGEEVRGITSNPILGSLSEQSKSDTHMDGLMVAEEAVNKNVDSRTIDINVVDEKPVEVFISDSSLGLTDTLFLDNAEISVVKNSELLLSEQVTIEEKPNPSTHHVSLDKKLADLSIDKLNEVAIEDGTVGEDQRSFSHEKYNSEVIFGTELDCNKLTGPDPEETGHFSEECLTSPSKSSLSPPTAEIQEDSPLYLETLPTKAYVYDPKLWGPMEIEVASGNSECKLLKHPLKLKSTYAEVEDYSGTRDPSREPEVTSYNRRFFGTVDYIWCSEGLHTVKVLDTIPKHVLKQLTDGFPTHKWGSDHIALACQLAFAKDTDQS